MESHDDVTIINGQKPKRDRAAINRENAQKSTGPRTQAGKERSSRNAITHGLTARTAVLPSEDRDAYRQFSEELIESLRPETPLERQLAQTIADLHWRLNRVFGIENGLLVLGQREHAGAIQAEDPLVHAALATAAGFSDHCRTFANLSIYEQRLSRIAERTLKQLQDLQATRREEFAHTMDAAVDHLLKHEMLNEQWDPAEDGFLYSRPEIEAEADRRDRIYEVRIANRCDFDREKYLKRMAA